MASISRNFLNENTSPGGTRDGAAGKAGKSRDLASQQQILAFFSVRKTLHSLLCTTAGRVKQRAGSCVLGAGVPGF